MHHKKLILTTPYESKFSNKWIIRIGKESSMINVGIICPCREIFFEAEKHIIELMKKNSYPRFIQSEQYRNLLQNAPNPLPKKAWVFLISIKFNYEFGDFLQWHISFCQRQLFPYIVEQ